MKNSSRIFIAFISIIGLMLSFSVLATPPGRVVAEVGPSGVTVFIPSAATNNSPVFSLGTAFDPGSGKLVEGYAIVHYASDNSSHSKKEFAKPPWAGGGKDKGGDTASSCYAFLAKDAKWKTTEDYIINSTNNAGLDEVIVRSLIAASLTTWDSEVGFEIFGSEITGTVDVANIGNLNGNNEVMFADIDSLGAIAVTYVWGIFGGRPSGRMLVEWDMVFDDADFDWSINGNASAMDFQNIATHEIGHAAGMGHPASECTEETMYAYASYGETKKRDLNAGDIAGIVKLYK